MVHSLEPYSNEHAMAMRWFFHSCMPCFSFIRDVLVINVLGSALFSPLRFLVRYSIIFMAICVKFEFSYFSMCALAHIKTPSISIWFRLRICSFVVFSVRIQSNSMARTVNCVKRTFMLMVTFFLNSPYASIYFNWIIEGCCIANASFSLLVNRVGRTLKCARQMSFFVCLCVCAIELRKIVNVSDVT